jgi:hypothetical protein
VAALETAPEWAALADEVLLADELPEIGRAHPGGQRLAAGRRLEQLLRLCAARLWTYGRHRD